ncbi:hypothetical protein ACROYT_G034986 [Oculina patagonica]
MQQTKASQSVAEGKGTPDSQLLNPWGLSVDSDGNIIVADTGDKFIKTFSTNGEFLMKKGGKGSLTFPIHCIQCGFRYLIVSDRGEHCIKVFDRNGNFVYKFEKRGKGKGDFKYAHCLSVNKSGHLMVCDSRNDRIQVFELNGKFVGKFGTNGSKLGEFYSLLSVAVLSNGRIVVSDYNYNQGRNQSCIEPLIPVITRIINISLESGIFPEKWKEAVVIPLLKKSGLDSMFKNLRPESNLAYISKLTERAVFNQTYDHLVRSGLYPQLQSAYRQYHSTETALVKVANDIHLNMNSQRVTLLVLLDLSAAFDTVYHEILLRRLTMSFGIRGKALAWFSSYLSGRSQRILFDGVTSDNFDLRFGVPQGSCLGPLLFVVYASKLFEIVQAHLPDAHCFADDTQLYLSFNPNSPTDQSEAVCTMERCISDLRKWM